MKRSLLLGGLVGVNVVFGLALMMPAAKADTSYVSTATVEVPSACSLTATVDTAHTASLINGIYSGGNDYYPNGIGKTTLTAFCNDASGFAIYAVGFSGDEYGATDMIGTNTGTTIPTGTATSGVNSQWAMKLTKVTDSTAYNPANMTITNGYDDYSAVPNDYDKVATFSSATDQTLGAKLTTTYAAYISNTQAADTYTGKVKYTLVHPATGEPDKPQVTTAGKIGYFPNASGVTDTMDDQSIGSSDTSAVLWASNFKRSGYGFAGWSDKFDWVLGANDTSGNGTGENTGYHIYGPNQTIEFTAGQYSTKGLSLYAVWVKSAGTLQNWSDCSSLAQGAVTALTDQRDNNTYAVAKLADGKCWMIENLRLDNTNSDNATGALAQGYGVSEDYGSFVGLANPETVFSGGTSANSIYYCSVASGTATMNICIKSSQAGSRMPRFRNDNTNTNTTLNPNITTNNMTGTNQNIYSYGNYYSWAAAKANTNFMGSTFVSSGENTSLCPKGWHLPVGGSSSVDEYTIFINNLIQAMSPSETPTGKELSAMARLYPNNFLFSGSAVHDSITTRGSQGYYWTSAKMSSGYSYYFTLYNNNAGTESVANDYFGFAIRCVAGSGV